MRQVTTTETDGDQFRACIATLFELHPNQAPSFTAISNIDFMDELFAFTRPLGLYPLVSFVEAKDFAYIDCIRGNYILSGVIENAEPRFVIGQGRFSTVFDPEAPFEPRKLEPFDGCYTVALFVRLM